MADSGALMTTARLTVTCEGKPSATAAKMTARAAVPKTNRVIGRIAFPPYAQATADAAQAPVPPGANSSLSQRKRLKSARQHGGPQMTLSPPTTLVFIASLILWALAVIGHFSQIPFITEHGFWVAVIAYVILAFGNLFRGL